MRDLLVFSGSSNPKLSNGICRNLTISKGDVSLSKFSNGETSVTMKDSVREKDVFVIQSGCGHVNDNFMELLVLISACKTASARRVTAVLPYFPYSRQPDVPYNRRGAPAIANPKSTYTYESAPGTPAPFQVAKSVPPLSAPVDEPLSLDSSNLLKTSLHQNASNSDNDKNGSGAYKQWLAQSGTLVANLLTCAGADHIVTMDLHDHQFQGFFDIPVDNLYSKPLLQHYILNCIPDYKDAVVVSPDSGGAKRAIAIADALHIPFALIHKERRTKKTGEDQHTPILKATRGPEDARDRIVATTMLVGDVQDKTCFLIDDIIDTSYTITRAAKLLKNQGAKCIIALTTHGVFSGDALNRVKHSDIDKVITTNTVPQESNLQFLGDKLEVLDVSRIFAEAIRRIYNGESVSMLFDHGW